MPTLTKKADALARASLGKTNRIIVLAKTDITAVENRVADLEAYVDRMLLLRSYNILSDVTVANTTTESTLYTVSTPVNGFNVGEVYELVMSGNFSIANGTDRFNVQVKFNNVAIDSFNSPLGAVTNVEGEMRISFTVRSIGSSGQVSFYNRFMAPSISADRLASSTTTMDTTSVNTLTITVTWTNADVGNTLTINNGYIKLVQ